MTYAATGHKVALQHESELYKTVLDVTCFVGLNSVSEYVPSVIPLRFGGPRGLTVPVFTVPRPSLSETLSVWLSHSAEQTDRLKFSLECSFLESPRYYNSLR
jgi:hypothetical protein